MRATNGVGSIIIPLAEFKGSRKGFVLDRVCIGLVGMYRMVDSINFITSGFFIPHWCPFPEREPPCRPV